MTLLLFFGFFLYANVLGSVSPNVARPLSVIADDDFALNQQDQIRAAPSPTAELLKPEAPASEAASPEAYLATHINPTQTGCRTDCAVGLPAATVYKWQQVTITSTVTVQTVTHVVNPEYFPNVTGTLRSFEYPEDPEVARRDRYSLDKEDGVVVTSLNLGYKMLAVTFPTPVTVTPTTLTLVGGPPATISQETPACTPAVVQSVNLTTSEDAKLFAFGDVEGSIDNAAIGNSTMPLPPNKSVKDTIHWRLVPEHYRQVDVGQYRSQFPYIMALDICGAFGPPDQPASVTQLTGNAWATITVTSTVSGSKDPRVNPLINLSKKPGTSLDGPGARPTDGMVHPFTVHAEHSAQAMSLPAQKSGIALPMMTEAPASPLAPSGQLVGPAPKPAPIQQQIESGGLFGSLTKLSPKPAIGGQSGGANKKAAPIVINGHTLTPKGRGTWESDDGQVLRIGGPQIELDNSSHGDGHKMKVGINSGAGGRDILVVDGASMTLGGDDLMPAATGSSRSGGRGKPGSTHGVSDDSSDMSTESHAGMKAGEESLAQYTGSAPKSSLNRAFSLAIGFIGVVAYL